VPLPFALPWIASQIRDRAARRSLVVFAAILGLPFVALAVIHPVANPNWKEWCWLAAIAGVIAIGHFIWRAMSSLQILSIVLALWILMPLPAVNYGHFPPKVLLPVIPAIILVLLRLSRHFSRTLAMACAGVMVVVGTGYSLLTLEADNRMADVARTAAKELITPRVAAGERVWFAGQWGFYWYAHEAGAKLTQLGAPGPQPGDLLAIPAGVAGNARTLARYPDRTLVSTVAYSCDCGRTMTMGAGLYSNTFGLLLWRKDRGEIARFDLWRVNR
jgi:hypothetical protein